MPQGLPQGALGPLLVPGSTEQRVALLLHLVDQECQHHQQREHVRQVLLAVPIVVLELLPRVLQVVERLVLDPPPRPAALHYPRHTGGGQPQVRHPGPLPLFPLGVALHIVQEVDPHLLIGLVEAHVMGEQVAVAGLRAGIDLLQRLDLVGLGPGGDLAEQVRVVPGLDAQDEMYPRRLQVADVWRVAAEGVFGHDDRQVGMVLAETLEPTPGGVALAVVLVLAVLTLDRLGRQGEDLREIRVNEGGPQQLVVVADCAVLVLPRQAMVAVDLLGREVFDPIQGNQLTTFQEDKLLQDLAALQRAEEVLEGGADLVRGHLVEDGPYLSIAGDGLEAEDRAEVVIQGATLESEQGGVLQAEQRQASHQGIGQSEGGAAPLLGQFLETTVGEGDQGIKVEVTTQTSLGGGLAHGSPSCYTRTRDGPRSLVYENRRYPDCFSGLSGTRRELLRGRPLGARWCGSCPIRGRPGPGGPGSPRRSRPGAVPA